MKKLVLFAAFVVAISLGSCKKAAQEPAIPDEETPILVEDATVEGVVEVVEDGVTEVAPE